MEILVEIIIGVLVCQYVFILIGILADEQDAFETKKTFLFSLIPFVPAFFLLRKFPKKLVDFWNSLE